MIDMQVDELATLITYICTPGSGRLFGMELTLNLGECDPRVIHDPTEMGRIVDQLIKNIGMTKHGKPDIDHFGEGELVGWTYIQKIKTSNVLVHANDGDRSVFANVFSCRAFDPELAVQFLVRAFGAQAHTAVVMERRVPGRGK